MLSHALPCLSMLWLICYALLCLAVLSFALLWFWGWPVSLSRTGRKMREIHTNYAAIWSQPQILRKNPIFDPICGGDHGRAQKVKIYNKNIIENHNEKSRDDFWRNLKGNPAFSLIFPESRRKKLYKNSGTHELGLPKHYKNSGTHEPGPPKHYKNSGTHDSGAIFLEPESCVPLFFSSRNRAYQHFSREK